MMLGPLVDWYAHALPRSPGIGSAGPPNPPRFRGNIAAAAGSWWGTLRRAARIAATRAWS